MGSGEKMTAYERQRLENIRRNTQMMASLNVHDRLSDLATSSKRLREEKSYKRSSEKKKKSEEPVVIRRSLRSQGIPPDSKGLPMDFNETLNPSKKTIKLSYTPSPDLEVAGPVSMKDAYGMEEGSYRAIIDKFTNITNSQSDDVGKSKTKSVANGVPMPSSKVERVNLDEPLDVNSLNLDSENIARVVPGKIYCVRFIPTTDMTMVVAGSKYGHLGFWDVKPEKEDEDVIHLYQPHASPISGIYVHPFSSSKVYTSSYDGFVRFMDIEREEFNLAYSSSSESGLFSLSLQPNDADSVYIGVGCGDLNVVDGRVGELTNSWSLHDGRINTIDFNPANPNIMVTSSSDGLACLWDLRKMDVKHSEPISLQSLVHKRAVHSAYFSPSGSSVATTSVDDNIGVICGVNFEDKFMIPHDNWTNRWISTFRATWGWDDTHLFIGNMKRRVDVVSVNQRKTIHTLESPLMSAIPCRYDAHPCTVGMLAGATSGGQIYLWTASL
ncbi:hypothetical protein RND81_03G082200 [Saponaria officinalis]|uniref:WD repeat-containing protein 76 n=1 Tax=Saponaria officinalis TaxID=3572 RepID=A0AAW1M625_SAPOF